jgi:hypothetical protein
MTGKKHIQVTKSTTNELHLGLYHSLKPQISHNSSNSLHMALVNVLADTLHYQLRDSLLAPVPSTWAGVFGW